MNYHRVIVEEIRVKNYSAEIAYDEDPIDPRSEDNLGIIICRHSDYDLGDDNNVDFEKFNSWDDINKHLVKKEKAICLLPLYLYDHSGLSISTKPFGCKWDSMQVGFIYTNLEKLEEYGFDANDTKKIKEILEKEREVYDKYISGEVYSVEIFKVETCNLGHEHKESVDTICGFYSVEDAKADCLEIIKNLEEEEIVNE